MTRENISDTLILQSDCNINNKNDLHAKQERGIMKKGSIKLKLGAITAALMMLIPLPVRAADEVTFTNFHFTMSPYEDKTQVVISNVKNSQDRVWKYKISSLSGVGTIGSGKIFYLVSKNRTLDGGSPMAASIHSEIRMNFELEAPYYGDCPTGVVYTLYATSNDTYGSSINAYVSGSWKP